MKPVTLFLHGCAIACLGTIWGCATWNAPPVAGPFFVAESRDAKMLQTLAKKQDSLAAKCDESTSCDHVHFTRALISLFDSREAAAKSFRRVIAQSPKSRLATSSQVWIELLQTTPSPRAFGDEKMSLLGQAAEHLVRDLLDREVVIQQLRTMKEAEASSVENLQRELNDREKKTDALSGKRDAAKSSGGDPVTVQVLQKQLSDRDKRIDELSSQLEALKRIDQEIREKTKPIRPPSGALPPLGTENRP